MTGVAALAICAAFTSCSKSDELYDPEAAKGISTEQEIANVYNSYNQAFIKTFGQVDPNVDWGFGKRAGTRSNPGVDYPATSTGINANANEWADPNKEFGGWIVPDPLTAGQKLRVQKYFQANPNLAYEDPHFRHFFVQQVYKGATDPGPNSTEIVTAADGSKYKSGNMNHLTVGLNEQHINNFNGGDCSSTSVLNNGQVVGGTSHNDQIMLMVNIDDTSCFGYHDTGSSNQSNANPNHNDKMALVSAAIIDAWAAQNGNPGEAVVDKWNRSFMGFDLAIKEGAQAYERDNSGNVIYATYDQAAESPKYAWDGQNIIEIGEQSEATGWKVVYKEGYENIMGCGWLTTNKNFYVAADQVNMSQTISMSGAQASTLVNNIQNAPVLKDVKVGDTNYQSVINLPRIKQLVDDGYLPVNNKSLTEWVKVGKSDGYFSDWIVTLTEAQRQIPSSNKVRIMAEDLNAQAADGDIENSDWDFNDVVFDVEFDETGNGGTITLICAGGVLPLKVAGVEVHLKFDPSLTQDEKGWYPMINTGKGMGIDRPQVSFHINDADPENNGKGILIEVEKTLSNGTKQWLDLRAQKGQPSSKFAVKPTVQPCLERDNINFVSERAFSRYVQGEINELIW